MAKIINVLSAAVSENGAVFYTDTGESIPISATDARVSEMIDKVYLAIREKRTPVTVDIETYSVFDIIEEESGGLMKFFRVAKKSLSKLLGVTPQRGNVSASGHVSKAIAEQNTPQPGTDSISPETRAALEKAHEYAKKNKTTPKDTTIVAVIGDTPIVGAERLQRQAEASVKFGDSNAFQNLMHGLASVAKDRKHTVQEALAFLEDMDLPLAVDGSVLAYKSLTRPYDASSPDVFVDNHSRTLKQGLGTLVQMDAELVDDNRRVLCSNGLHVAQRGYLGGYGTSGSNVICLIKIDPRDIIAVPLNEKQKMRVRAYHIVAVLNDSDLKAIREQKSITKTSEGNANLLGRIIAGDHVPVLNVTTQHKNGDIDQMIPLDQTPADPLVLLAQMAVSVPQARTLDDLAVTTVKKTDIEALNQKIEEDARFEDGVPNEANEVSQDDLEAAAEFLDAATDQGLESEKLKIDQVKKAKPKKADVKKARQMNQKKEPKQVAIIKENKTRQAYASWISNKNDSGYSVLMYAKKSAKKSWTALGFTAVEVANIESYKPKG